MEFGIPQIRSQLVSLRAHLGERPDIGVREIGILEMSPSQLDSAQVATSELYVPARAEESALLSK